MSMVSLLATRLPGAGAAAVEKSRAPERPQYLVSERAAAVAE